MMIFKGLSGAEKEALQYGMIVVISLDDPARVAEYQAAGRDVLSNHAAGANGGTIPDTYISTYLCMRANIHTFTNHQSPILSFGCPQFDPLKYGAARPNTAISYLNSP